VTGARSRIAQARKLRVLGYGKSVHDLLAEIDKRGQSPETSSVTMRGTSWPTGASTPGSRIPPCKSSCG